jgi:hypothetical protein
MSVITTFTTDEITFVLAGYISIDKTGTALMTSGEKVPFVVPPKPVPTIVQLDYQLEYSLERALFTTGTRSPSSIVKRELA